VAEGEPFKKRPANDVRKISPFLRKRLSVSPYPLAFSLAAAHHLPRHVQNLCVGFSHSLFFFFFFFSSDTSPSSALYSISQCRGLNLRRAPGVQRLRGRLGTTWAGHCRSSYLLIVGWRGVGANGAPCIGRSCSWGLQQRRGFNTGEVRAHQKAVCVLRWRFFCDRVRTRHKKRVADKGVRDVWRAWLGEEPWKKGFFL